MNSIGVLVIVALSLFTYSGAQVRIQLNREETPLKEDDIKLKGNLNLLKSAPVPQILKNYKNVYYYGNLRIGTPGDNVRVIFDTGSPSLWVYSGSGFRSWTCIPCWLHNTYHHSRSSTYSADGRLITISYVSGYMKGFVSQDILTIGNLSARVEFAEATSSPILDSIGAKYDGILGLSPCSGPNCRVYKQFTSPVINEILSQLPQPVFSVYLSRDNSKKGEIMFGGTNPELYKEKTLVMHKTSSPYMWSLTIEKVYVGDVLVLNYTRNVDAYIDTGTSLIAGPPQDVNKILWLMDISPGLQVSCQRTKLLPPLTFVIGGKNYTLSSEQYATTSTTTLFGGKVCYHGLQAVQVGTGGWILGDLFLANFYTVFEAATFSTSRIGFAELK